MSERVNQSFNWPKLIVGIKRRVHRRNDKRAAQADQAYRAVRDNALKKADYTCMFCGFRSVKHSQIHHLDDDHHNNAPENLGCVCLLCHPYHHVGEPSKMAESEAFKNGHLGDMTRLIRVPDAQKISAQDMNHLLRAIGIALADPDEEADAKKVLSLLVNKHTVKNMQDSFISDKSSDLAAGFSHLTDDEYEARASLVEDVRLIFAPNLLQRWGRAWRGENLNLFSKPAHWATLVARWLEVFDKQEAINEEVDLDDEVKPEGQEAISDEINEEPEELDSGDE